MMKSFRSNSYLFGGNAPYVEELYENYLNNPGSVPDTWRAYFDNMQAVPAADGSPDTRDVAHAPIVKSFAERAKEGQLQPQLMGGDIQSARKQVFVIQLIARLPLPRLALRRPRSAQAPRASDDPRARAGLLRLHRRRPRAHLFGRQHLLRLRDRRRCATSCRPCGTPTAARSARSTCTSRIRPSSAGSRSGWRSTRGKFNFAAEKKKHILERLTAAEGLERYLHTKYVGQKRFSLEGGESFIAAMDELVQQAGAVGIQEMVIGMAHRGRLNVLVNVHGQDAQGPVRRVRRQPRRGPAQRRRQVPPRLLQRRLDARRAGAPVARLQPVAPRDRQSGGGRLGQGAPGAPRRQGRLAGAVGAGARRRRLRRPGRGDGDAQPDRDPRLRHPRHGAHRHQQPDRLHHLRRPRRALHALLHRRRQVDRGAGLPRQRRRSRGGGLRHPARAGIPDEVPQGRRSSTSSASASWATTSRTRRRSPSR